MQRERSEGPALPVLGLWTARVWRFVVLALAMATVAIGVSHVTQHSNMQKVLTTEHSIVQGEPIVNRQVLYPLYNRVLFPAIFDGFTKTLPSIPEKSIFVGLRYLAFALSFVLIFLSIDARALASQANSTALCLVVAVCFIATMIRHPEPSTSDIFDLLIMFYVSLHLMEGRVGIAFILALFTAINRESGAFAGVLYFFLRAGAERPVRLLAISAGLAIFPYLLALGVRRSVYRYDIPSSGFGQWLTGLQFNLTGMLEDVLRFNPANDTGLLLAMFALPTLMLWERPTAPRGMRMRVALACASIFLISLQFGLAREIRIFIPCIALLVAATVADFGSGRRSRPEVSD